MIKVNQEVKENIEFVLALVGMISLSIISIWLWTTDYVEYKKHPSEYTVTMQKITRIRTMGNRGRHGVCFEYEVNGEKQEGQVDYAFSDKVGKKIKIAFDQDMNYMRPELLIGSMMIWMILINIVTLVLTLLVMAALLIALADKIKSFFHGGT